MRSIIWRQTSGKTHRVVIDEGQLVSPLRALPDRQSRILKNVHASTKGLHDAGLLNAALMRQFDTLTEHETP